MRILVFVAEEDIGALPFALYNHLIEQLLKQNHQVFLSLPSQVPFSEIKGIKQRKRAKRHLNHFPFWFYVWFKGLLTKYVHPRYPLHHKTELNFKPQKVFVFTNSILDDEFYNGSWLFNILKESGAELIKVCSHAFYYSEAYNEQKLLRTLNTLEHWHKILFSSKEVWQHNERLIGQNINGSIFKMQLNTTAIETKKVSSYTAKRIFCPLPINLKLHGQDHLLQACSSTSQKVELLFVLAGPDVEALKKFASNLEVSIVWLSPDEDALCNYVWINSQVLGIREIWHSLYNSPVPFLNLRSLNLTSEVLYKVSKTAALSTNLQV